MLGLDASGKTTIEWKLRLAGNYHGVPGMLGFSVSTFEYDSFEITSFDIGGQDKIRVLWAHYYPNIKGLIFVVDSNDRERLAHARDELHMLMAEEELDGVALLVIANKQDLPGRMTVSEVSEGLELPSFIPRPWHILASCATSGDGLNEAFAWLRTTCAATAFQTMLQPATHLPGDYTANARLRVRQRPGQGTIAGYLERSTILNIEEVATGERKRHWSYGFIRSIERLGFHRCAG